ncbi:MAG: TlpA disulfide reductase family protein [Candidatus Cyclobacteriaceae bacterium M2_1C_046]
MKKYIACFSIFLLLSLFTESSAQVKIIKFEELNNYLNSGSDKVKVINFWATWCAPCIKELPYFEALQETYSNKDLELLLVSLDFVEQKEKVTKFLEKKDITANVWLLDESDANSYIDKVDPRWSGAIPMTIIINPSTEKRIFLEKELTKEELEKNINTLLN